LQLVDHLVTHRTLHKAARLLSISQPAATGMLNDLEQLLGLQLFTRSRQGMTPTPATWALLDKVRTLLNEFTDLTATL
jgi:DNA-binding transcriptional LysR family regulator